MLLLQIATRFSNKRKTRRQKDGCSLQRVRFIRAWITLYSCTLDLMYASVHHFLNKKRNLLFIAKYFLFYDFSRKYLCKTWWYHENFINQMKCFKNIHLSIKTKNSLSKDLLMFTIGVKTQFIFKFGSSHNWFSKGSLIEGEQDFKFHGSSNVSL